MGSRHEQSFMDGFQDGFRRGRYLDGFQEGQFMGYRARLRPRYHDEIAYDKDYDDDDDEKKQDLLHGIEQLVQPGAKLTKAALKELVEQYRNNSDNETDSDDDDSDYSENEDDDDEDKDKEDQYD